MKKIITIGASRGGVPALIQLTGALPADLPAPVLIVLHIGAHESVLPRLLGRSCPLPVHLAGNGQPVEPGHVYVAPPDHHLLVQSDHLLLTRGPKEHHARPAIDPLFRSAALAYGPRAIGVVLTGDLDDGTAGLQAIKLQGGTAVVQDPEDALAPSMPRSALRYVAVDHCVPLARMPALFDLLTHQDSAAPDTWSPAMDHEHELSLRRGAPVEHLLAIGKPSTFVCPDCHGSLWEVTGAKPQRFRCHTGHAYSLRSLDHALAEKSDDALQNALRAFQERQFMLAYIADAERAQGSEQAAAEAEVAAHRLRQQVQHLDALAHQELPRPATD